MTKAKICGLKDVETALYAARCGAGYIGLVFAPGRRQVTAQIALTISNAIHSLDKRPKLVGVFVNEEAAQINHLGNCCGLDAVQLSGEEDMEYCRLITKPIIKTVHVAQGSNAVEINARVAEICNHGFSCLLDTKIGGKFGGTGKTFNWQIAAEVANHHPVIVAGGLTPQNVGWLIGEAKPWGVDVSGGVETAGVKDNNKIKAFLTAVRQADTTGEVL